MPGRLHVPLSVVTKVGNRIKSNVLHDHLFGEFCGDNDEDFTRLLLHTEVWWLPKGNSLRRYVALWDAIEAFFSGQQIEKKRPPALKATYFIFVI